VVDAGIARRAIVHDERREPDRAARVAAFRKASRAWNADGGPIEKTVKAGEDLYFAAHFLIEDLLGEAVS